MNYILSRTFSLFLFFYFSAVFDGFVCGSTASSNRGEGCDRNELKGRVLWLSASKSIIIIIMIVRIMIMIIIIRGGKIKIKPRII